MREKKRDEITEYSKGSFSSVFYKFKTKKIHLKQGFTPSRLKL